MFKGVSDQTITEVFNGVPVTLRFKWNTRFKFWSLSVFDRQNNPIVCGLKLVRDYPLISRLRLRELNGELVMSRLYGDWDMPRFDSLPAEMALVWMDPDDIEAARNGTL